MSAPARICRNWSACDAVRVNRGSTTIIFALRFSLASTAHLKPHGWFSAGFPPMINIMSVFLMSIQPLVIAPRPKVGPKLETDAFADAGFTSAEFNIQNAQGSDPTQIDDATADINLGAKVLLRHPLDKRRFPLGCPRVA